MSKLGSKKIRLGIFDIDGTIFRSSLFLELFYALIDHKIFPKKAEQEVRPYLMAWQDRKGHYNDYLMKAVEVHYAHLIGKKKSDVDRVARQMTNSKRNRVYRYTRDLIRDLKTKGYYLIAISNSQDYTVSHFANKIGFDDSIARELEVKNNCYTGRVSSGGKIIKLSDHIDKVQILKDFLLKKGMEADFNGSIAVGDTEGDLAMLKLVGQPIAFNPSSGLAKIAKKEKWKIVVERKDTVYEISNHCSIIDKGERQNVSWK